MTARKVGERPWFTHAGNVEVRKACPVCDGKREVVLILGTGERVVLPCDYCGRGFDGPSGSVTESEWQQGAIQRTIAEVRSVKKGDGEEIEYLTSDSYVYREPNVYDTEAEAIAACEAVCAALEEDQRTRAEHIKANVKKTYTWNAGYHMREAARLEKQIAYHREKAKLCKAKAGAEEEAKR